VGWRKAHARASARAATRATVASPWRAASVAHAILFEDGAWVNGVRVHASVTSRAVISQFIGGGSVMRAPETTKPSVSISK